MNLTLVFLVVVATIVAVYAGEEGPVAHCYNNQPDATLAAWMSDYGSRNCARKRTGETNLGGQMIAFVSAVFISNEQPKSRHVSPDS